MRHTRGYDARTDPTSAWGQAFHHVSYALFRTDGCFGEIVATRWPEDHYLRVGDLLQTALPLTDDEVAYLMRDSYIAAPLFVCTDAGLGLLSKCYDLRAGLGLYLQIHTRPDAGARLLRMGALGQETGAAFSLSGRIRSGGTPDERLTPKDTESFAALLDAWRMAQTVEHGFLSTREEHWLELTALRDALEALADLAGCTLTFDGECSALVGRRVKCYRPTVTEAMLLYTLSEIRNHAADRHAVCRLGLLEGMDGARMSLSLHYDIDREHLPVRVREELERARRYMIRVAEHAGLALYFPPLAIPKLRRHLYSNPLPNHGVYLEWQEDPFLLPSSDLKSALSFETKSDEDERAAEAYDRSVMLAYRERKQFESTQ